MYNLQLALNIHGCSASVDLSNDRLYSSVVLLPGKSMDGGVRQAVVHGVTKSQTRLSDFTFTFYFHALEKEMATHFSILAWNIPWTEEPGGLQSMGHKSQTRLSD